MKPVVISLHGIRTRGAWQKRLSELCSGREVICVSADYGYLSLAGFYLSALFDGKTEWFLREYERTVDRYRDELTDGALRRYPSLIAHSFGTLIAGLSMLKYEEIRFERVIVCGSILPVDFPWDLLFQRDQVLSVRHEFGVRDIWAWLGGRLFPRTGISGKRGFGASSPQLHQKRYAEYRHSDFFSESHIREEWLPLLKKDPPRFRIKHGREIHTTEEFELMARETFDIDNRVYGSIPEYAEVQPDLALATKWLEVEPDVFTFLYDEKAQRYVGYVTALFVRPDAVDDLVRRGLEDRLMTPEVLASTHDGEAVSICAVSIATDPAYRDVGEGYHSTQVSRLLGALCHKLEYLAHERRVNIREIVAVGWTDQGRRICEKIIGMPKVGKDRFGNPIFRLRLEGGVLRKRKKPYLPLCRVADLYRDLDLTN